MISLNYLPIVKGIRALQELQALQDTGLSWEVRIYFRLNLMLCSFHSLDAISGFDYFEIRIVVEV